MSITSFNSESRDTQADHWQQRVDLAACFRWIERLDMHEAVANHLSCATNEDGTEFLLNPNQRHFSRIKASELLLLNAKDKDVLSGPDAPDATAWGLHGSIHRRCPHARCLMHVHSTYATVLASLEDAQLPAIDQNSGMFFNRVVIDTGYQGLALESEGERCAALLQNPLTQIMVMGNHGVLAIGRTIAEAFNRLYYFERSAKNYILALQTGKALSVLSDDVAEKLAASLDDYYQDDQHLEELKAILDEEGSNYAS